MTEARLSSASLHILRRFKKGKVAVLKGGWSKEREISLKTGASIEASLRRLRVPFVSLDVAKDIFYRLPKVNPQLAFIALHGTFGEDGGVQAGLDILRIPYTGSGAIASALAMDKVASKRIFDSKRIPTPAWTLIHRADYQFNPASAAKKAESWLRSSPVFVKPSDQGSAIGAGKAASRKELQRALQRCFQVSPCALIENFVRGRELTVGILGEKCLPIVEIIPEHAFYDFHSKYAKGGSRHVVPAQLSPGLAKKIQKISLAAFRSLGCRAYGRVDILVDLEGRPWVLEVNTIPGMTSTSLLPDAAQAEGLGFDELVLQIMHQSLINH